MISNAKLHYTDSGSGPPVFLIHAFPMNRGMWDAQVDALRDRFRLLTPDLPGFGESPDSVGWRIADAARSVLDIADRNALPRFGVVGLSMGCYAAFELWRIATDRVHCLVLASGRARADNAGERQVRTRLIGEVQSEGLVTIKDALLPRILRSQPDPDVAAYVRKTLAQGTPDTVANALEALRERADSTPLLGRISCPTLVLAGESDPITTTPECREMAQAIPGARFLEIPEAGHLCNLENPAVFNEAVGGFLEVSMAGLP